MADQILEGLPSREAGEKVIVLPSVTDIITALQRFGWVDYTLFSLMLLISLVIGAYFGIFHRNQSTQEYLFGSKKMRIFPISMSLIASFISGISLLGIPTEVYLYGIQFGYVVLGLILMGFVFNTLYLPVFAGLQLTSTYEYHERRFDKKVRLLGSLLFSLKIITWLPIVMYVPALAFNQVTGINVHLMTPIVCALCILYTSMGGIKAVVWTDVIQALVMFLSMIVIAIKGTISVGGFSKVWTRNWETGRIELPSFALDPFYRHTIWSLTIGGCFYYLESAALSQDMIQRYLSLPSIQHTRKAVWLYIFGMTAIVLVCGYCGLLIYATFHQCDPLSTMLAKEKDQLLPLLVMDVLADWPGLTGIFMAGVLSASLSSLSTGLNSMAAVILEDFYKFCFSKPLSEKQSGLLMKLSVIVLGGICVGLVYVVENLGTVLQLTMSVGTIVSGPTIGLFTMGILLPWVNSKGALIGGISSITFMSWLGLKVQSAITSGNLQFQEKPVTTEGCHYHFVPKQTPAVNIHFNSSAGTGGGGGGGGVGAQEEIFLLYRISYLWYGVVGALVSIVVGLIVSFLTKPNDPRDIEPALLAPCIRKLIKPRVFPNEPTDGIIYAYETTEEKLDNNGKSCIPLRVDSSKVET